MQVAARPPRATRLSPTSLTGAFALQEPIDPSDGRKATTGHPCRYVINQRLRFKNFLVHLAIFVGKSVCTGSTGAGADASCRSCAASLDAAGATANSQRLPDSHCRRRQAD